MNDEPMKLEKFLMRCTPLPWKKRNGNNATENEVCRVRGVTIFGPRKSVDCGDDARYIEHAANVLPNLVAASREFQYSVLKNGGVSQELIFRLQSALAAAEEVKE